MNKEEILVRQRKELRDLTATITSLKKQATKKTRKNVLIKCQEMEDLLKKKHLEELEQINGQEFEQNNDKSISINSKEDNEKEHQEKEKEKEKEEQQEVTPESLLATLNLDKQVPKSDVPVGNAEGPKKKRNRAKERLAKRQQEIERMQQEAREEMANVIDYRGLEQEHMNETISQLGMKLHEISPDGNCLFSSIQDQLKDKKIEAADEDIKALRHKAAEYIRQNQDDFIPYMYNEETDELEDIEEYCTKLETTAMWGSDKEILAFAKIYDCPISIISFDTGTKKINTLTINEQSTSPQLYLAYYRHSYSLGEHYNSLRSNISTP